MTIEELVNEELDTTEYPSSDGEPLAETEWHAVGMAELRSMLVRWLDHLERRDSWVGMNQFWYWEKGNVGARRAPDVMVALGVQRYMRNSFLSWKEEVKAPSVIFEFTSRGTIKIDREDKFAIYAKLGVQEYVMFDPRCEELRQQLLCYRLVNGVYQRIPKMKDGSYELKELSCWVMPEGHLLRIVDPATGELFPTSEENERIATRQSMIYEHLIDQEKARVEQLQQEIEQLRLQLAAMKPTDDSK